MPICKFFQQGNCRYGDRCWNEHINNYRNDNRYQKVYNSGGNNHNNYNQSQITRQVGQSFSFKNALATNTQAPIVAGHSFGNTFNNFQQPQPSFSFMRALQNAPNQLQSINQVNNFSPTANAYNATQFTQQQMHSSAQATSFSFKQQLQQQHQQQYQQEPEQFYNQKVECVQITEDDIDMSAMYFDNGNRQMLSNQQMYQNNSNANVSATAQTVADDNNNDFIYTPDEKLSKENQHAYKAGKFILGQIPIDPPSKALCA